MLNIVTSEYQVFRFNRINVLPITTDLAVESTNINISPAPNFFPYLKEGLRSVLEKFVMEALYLKVHLLGIRELHDKDTRFVYNGSEVFFLQSRPDATILSKVTAISLATTYLIHLVGDSISFNYEHVISDSGVTEEVLSEASISVPQNMENKFPYKYFLQAFAAAFVGEYITTGESANLIGTFEQTSQKQEITIDPVGITEFDITGSSTGLFLVNFLTPHLLNAMKWDNFEQVLITAVENTPMVNLRIGSLSFCLLHMATEVLPERIGSELRIKRRYGLYQSGVDLADPKVEKIEFNVISVLNEVL